MPKGTRFSVTRTWITDSVTGHRMLRMTDLGANDQLLYFTSSSLTADDRYLVFISDRDGGHPNLYSLDCETSEAVQLTSNQAGELESYVYFDGNREGLGKASVSLHSPSGDVYYIQGRPRKGAVVRKVNAVTLAELDLAELPADHLTAFTHVSDDNSLLCVPIIHESAFSEGPKRISPLVDERGMKSQVLLVRTDGTGTELAWEEPAWVTHVQFQPGRTDVILYNHEWCATPGIRRMGLWDPQKGARRVRPVGGLSVNGSRMDKDDWVCHEMWHRDGEGLIYHGTTVDKVAFVGAVGLDCTGHVELAFPEGWTRYGHFTVSNDSTLLVTDGVVEVEGVANTGLRQAQWISLVRADWANRRLSWLPLCQSGSSWSSQDAHPHPIFSHSGREVLFTADPDGRRAIYIVPVDEDLKRI